MVGYRGSLSRLVGPRSVKKIKKLNNKKRLIEWPLWGWVSSPIRSMTPSGNGGEGTQSHFLCWPSFCGIWRGKKGLAKRSLIYLPACDFKIPQEERVNTNFQLFSSDFYQQDYMMMIIIIISYIIGRTISWWHSPLALATISPHRKVFQRISLRFSPINLVLTQDLSLDVKMLRIYLEKYCDDQE